MNVCYFDFAYPLFCDDEIVPLVRRDSDRFTCASTAGLPQAAVGCDVVLGLEATGVHALGFRAGASYNASTGLGVLVPSTAPSPGGWAFLYPFAWQVWVTFAAMVLAVVASQTVLAWAGRSKPSRSGGPGDGGPGNGGPGEALPVFSAMLGSSRFYAAYDGAFTQHATSMIVAVFSVFFTALYQSNLVASFFNPKRNFDIPDSVSAHWLHSRRVRDELGARFEVTSVYAMPDPPTYTIAPRRILAPFCDRSYIVGVPAPSVLYTMGFAPEAPLHEISRAVALGIRNLTYPALPSACDAPDTARPLSPASMWGLFLVASLGMGWSLGWRIVRAVRTGETTRDRFFGPGFRWFGLLGQHTMPVISQRTSAELDLPGSASDPGPMRWNGARRWVRRAATV